MTPRTTLAFALLCLIWGSTWLVTSVLGQAPPMRTAAIRFTLAALVLVPFVLVRKPGLPKLRAAIACFLLATTTIALPYSLLIRAEKHISSGMTAIFFAILPLVAGLYTNYLEARRMPQNAMYALLLGIAGVVLLLSTAFSISFDQATGALAVLILVIIGGLSSVYAKRELADVHPSMSALLQLFSGSVLMGAMSTVFERGQVTRWNGPAIFAILFLGLIASAVAYPLYFYLLKEMQPYQLGTVLWFQPLVAVAEGAILLREPLSWRLIAGGAIIFVAAALVLTVREQDDEPVTLEITR